MATRSYRDVYKPIKGAFLSGWGARLFGLSLGLATWYFVAWIFPMRLMPYPGQALELVMELFRQGVVMQHLIPTFIRTILGFLGALFFGAILGIMMGLNNYSRQFLTPYVVAGLSIPAIAWAAVATIIFGFGHTAPVVAAVLITFPYAAINIWTGVENIDGELIKMSQAFEVSNLRLLYRMIIPNTAPAIFSASRFSLAISWKIVTLAEIFAARRGVGQQIIQSYNTYNYEFAWAWAIIFMSIILAIEYLVFKPLERRAFKYRSEADFETIGR